MNAGPLLVLVGAPGAGKTTVGRRVARELDVPFADSDEIIERQAGKSVAEIFIDDGESAFRSLEREAISRALVESTGVLALGGGAVLDPATREALGGHTVIWLRVGISAASDRVGMTASRPLLLGNVRGTLIRLLDERTPLYEEVASACVDTDGIDEGEVAHRVLEIIPGGSRAVSQ